MKHVAVKTVIMVLLLLGTFLSAEATKVETVTVNALTTTTLAFELNDENRFSGSLSIVGGSNNDVDFWVTDPLGAKILDMGRVSQGGTFEFDAKANGTYVLHFSNTFSLLTPKNVTLTYDVEEPSRLGIEPFVLAWGALIAVCIVVVAVAIMLSMRKPKQENKSAEPPKSQEAQLMPCVLSILISLVNS